MMAERIRIYSLFHNLCVKHDCVIFAYMKKDKNPHNFKIKTKAKKHAHSAFFVSV